MKNAMKKTLVMLLTLALLLSGGAMSALAAGATAVEDTLIVGINSEPNSLSGILQGVDPNGKVCANLYNKLVKLDPATNEIVPDLAESWEMVDDTTWKFSIRQGVKFHNGATLTAEDCLFSIQQNTYAWMWGAIDRENSYCEDENTLVVKTYEFYPALISMLSSECRIVCKAAWEEMGEDGYSRNPIGTGPYKFVEWVAGDSIMLERFDEYWGEPAYYTNLVYRFIVDDTTRSLSLENGEIDMAQDLPASQVEYLEMSGAVDIVSYPSLSMDYIGFNCQRAPFNDARVRQALRYAIDLDGMVKIAYGSTATPADGICSPTFVDYVPAEGEYVYTQDVEKAKALLAEAGYPDGFNCKLMVTSKQSRVDMVEMLQNAWTQIGVNIEVYVTEIGNYYDIMQSGDFDMFYGGWVLLANEGDLMHDTFYSTEKLWYNTNYTAYVNPEFDKLVDAARASADASVRAEYYGEVQNLIRKELPFIACAWVNKVNGVSKSLTGYPNDPSNYPLLAYVHPVEE
ncbi:MAG: ABC transporter substrate-binding protein [Clostridia bacterium]|nr:ABC transporter substrate-binding protein [Clostridia bacterium]